ncbi:FecR/PupR family sigma factor regulator [Pseudomonas abieticivorans]|uniref:FecR/PupR family sigma factor regulator n=1 Tax=Pseudomonas abieticivorans TaxID=2931382 RepID=UPI0020BD521A|nr:DUF4880 domain-containing protein [Pseudomonas sp. PIA16]
MDHSQSINETAAHWAVRQQAGPLNLIEQSALEQWLAQNPQHAQALAYAERTWAALGQMTAADL